MKVDLTFALKIVTDETKTQSLTASPVAVSGIQSTSHKRKGSRRRKAKTSSLVKKFFQAIGNIPSHVLTAVVTALLSAAIKTIPK